MNDNVPPLNTMQIEIPADGDDSEIADQTPPVSEFEQPSGAEMPHDDQLPIDEHVFGLAVPLIRPVRLGIRGPDALAVKRALVRKGFSRGTQTRLFGPLAVRALKKWQRAYKLPADGVYGPESHRTMVASHGFDRFGRQLMGQVHIIPNEDKRKRVAAFALFCVPRASEIHYTQGSSRMYGVRNHVRPPQVPPYEDCSSFCTWLYWLVGGPDPNARGFDGYGFTGTMTPHGRQVSNPSMGDLVFYGGSFATPGHVAVYVGEGMVVSHGSEIGPIKIPWNYRSVMQVRSYL